MALHPNLTDEELHVPGYVQDSDPGAVGAGILWIDTTGGIENWILKVRNAADDGWELPASGGSIGVPAYDDNEDVHWSFTVNYGVTVDLFPDQAAFSGTVLDTGDGATSSFDAATSGNYVLVIPGTVAISVLLTDAATANIVDDGNGNLSDVVNGITGTVGYGDGDWSLNFSGAVPANLADITMDGEYWFGSPIARVNAQDLIQSVKGGFRPFEYAVLPVGTGPPLTTYPNPIDAFIELDCASAGGQVPIDVYVYDAFGNNRYVTIFVNVQDNAGLCGGP